MKHILTIAAMAEWAAKRPAAEEYTWFDIGMCPCGQYAREHGLADWYDPRKDRTSPFWDEANSIAYGRPRTFGALAERLRAVAG